MIGSRGSADKVMLGPDDRASGSIMARRAVFHAEALIDGCWVIEQLKGGHAAMSVRRTVSPFRASSRGWFSSAGSSTAFGADSLPSSEIPPNFTFHRSFRVTALILWIACTVVFQNLCNT